MLNKLFIQKIKEKLPQGSFQRKLYTGTTWTSFGIVIDRGSNLLSFAIAANILSLAKFGELGLIYSTVAMVGVFAGLGLKTTATKYVAQYKDFEKQRAGKIISVILVISILLSLSSASVLFFSANLISRSLFNAEHLNTAIKYAAFFVVFESMYNSQQGIIVGYEKFNFLFISNLVKGVLTIVFVTFGIYEFGIEGAIAGFAIASFFSWLLQIVLILKTNKLFNVHLTNLKLSSESNIIYRFALPAFLASAMMAPALWGTRTLLANTPNGYEQLGILTAVTKFKTGLTLVGMALGYTLIPLLTSPKHKNNQNLKKINILLPWFIGLLPAIPIILFPEVLPLIFGSKYAGEYEYTTLIIVMAFTILALYKQGLGRVLIVKDMMWWSVLSNSIWSIILIGCVFMLRKYGAMGIALSFLIAYIINVSLFVPIYINKNLAPRNTLVSKEAFLIWAIVIVIVLVHFLHLSYYINIVILIVFLLFMFLFMGRMYKSN